MLGLEKIADLFDMTHEENKKYLGDQFQDWVDNAYKEYGDGWRFKGVAATAATLDALHTFSGAVASGFLDTLRVGEGVKEHTAWGVVKDGLRVMTVASGVSKVVRLSAAAVEIGGPASCTVSSSAKAAALSGREVLHTAFENLAEELGGAAKVSAEDFGGTRSPLQLIDGLRKLGGRITGKEVESLEDVVELAKNTRAPVIFGYTWKTARATGAHTMVAFRDLFGRVKFADQLGRIASELPGFETGIFPRAAVVHDAAIVKTLRIGNISHVLATRLYRVPPHALARIEDKVRQLTGRPSPLPRPAGKNGSTK
jgi:hypothetical protein